MSKEAGPERQMATGSETTSCCAQGGRVCKYATPTRVALLHVTRTALWYAGSNSQSWVHMPYREHLLRQTSYPYAPLATRKPLGLKRNVLRRKRPEKGASQRRPCGAGGRVNMA